ncbi:MAG: hypothetical protein ACRDWY_12980 [Actinomycetes bacterium]
MKESLWSLDGMCILNSGLVTVMLIATPGHIEFRDIGAAPDAQAREEVRAGMGSSERDGPHPGVRTPLGRRR